MKIKAIILMVISVVMLSACGTTDDSLRKSGKNEAYIQGFHDGRHSGMNEAGNSFENYIKDTERFAADTSYKSGWLAGEVEGKKLQKQATSIGSAAGNVYSASQISKEVNKNQDIDKIGNDAMKNVDTSDLKSLEKNN